MNKNIIFILSTIISSILSVLSLIILTRLFTPDIYGYANLIISYAVVASVFISISIDQVIIYYYKKSLLKDIFKTYLIIVPFILFFLIILYQIISSLNLIENLPQIHYILLYAIALVINKIYFTVFRMTRNAFSFLIQSTGVKLFELLLVIIFAYIYNNNFEVLIYCFIVSVALLSLIQFSKLFKLTKVEEEHYENGLNVRAYLFFSMPLSASILITTITQNLDKIILINYVNIQDLGIYFSAHKLIGITMIIYTILGLIWVPKNVNLQASLDKKSYNYFLINSVKLFQVIALLMIVFVSLLGDYIILILGESYRESLPLFQILIVIPIVMIITEVYSSYITVMKKTYYHLVISSISLLVFAISLPILAERYSVYGALISIFTTYLIINFLRVFFSFIIDKKVISISNVFISILILTSLILINDFEFLSFFILFITLVYAWYNRKPLKIIILELNK